MDEDDEREVEQIAELIAGKIAGQLQGSVISSALPAEVGDWIRQTCTHNAMYWTYSIPMQPAGTCICTRWQLNPDGTLQLQLDDTNGRTFWRGTFRPAEEAAGSG